MHTQQEALHLPQDLTASEGQLSTDSFSFLPQAVHLDFKLGHFAYLLLTDHQSGREGPGEDIATDSVQFPELWEQQPQLPVCIPTVGYTEDSDPPGTLTTSPSPRRHTYIQQVSGQLPSKWALGSQLHHPSPSGPSQELLPA